MRKEDYQKITEMFDFSIIIPVFNVENYLKECVESCLRQEGVSTEIILVDDGSKDSSGRICDEYAQKHENIRVIHQQNQGQSKARNVAILQSSGKYLVFLDSDDYIVAEDVLKTFLSVMEKNDLDCVWGSSYDADNPRPTSFKPLNAVLSGREYLIAALNSSAYDIVPWLKVIKREFFIKNDLFFIEGCAYEDQEYTLKLLLVKDSKMMRIDLPFYYYRTNYGSVTHLHDLKKGQDMLNVISSMIDLGLASDPDINFKKYVDNVIALAIYHFSVIFVHLGDSDRKTLFDEVRKDKVLLKYARKTSKLHFRIKIQNRLFISFPSLLRLIYRCRHA